MRAATWLEFLLKYSHSITENMEHYKMVTVKLVMLYQMVPKARPDADA